MIAGWLLVAAFAANAWLQFVTYSYADDLLDRVSTLVTNIVRYPLSLVELLQIVSAYTFSWLGLLGGVLALSLRHRSFAIVGAAFFAVQYPIDFLWLATTSGLSVGEAFTSMFSWGVAYGLGNLGNFLAVVAGVIALTSKRPNTAIQVNADDSASAQDPEFEEQAPASESPIPAVKPVAYDTQTGRPILRYDTRTGKPIYADEPGATE